MSITVNQKEESINKIDLTNLKSLRDEVVKFLFEDMNGDIPLIPLHGINLKTMTCTCSQKEKCKSPGKHPKLKSGWKDIGMFEMQKHLKVDKLYEINKPNQHVYNFGALCGLPNKESGKFLVVVDVDHKDPWSLEIIQKLIASNQISFGYRTGSGGLHLWYYSDVQIRNSIKTIHPNIDIKGIGGYVVIPGSVHVGSGGNLYDFQREAPYEQHIHKPILDLPSCLKEAIQTSVGTLTPTKVKQPSKGYKKTKSNISITTKFSLSQLRSNIESNKNFTIPNGIRNDSIYKLLSEDRRNGSGKSVVALYERAKKYRMVCEEKESLSNQELYLIAKSAYKSNKPFIDKTITHRNLADNYFDFVSKNRDLRYSDEAKEKMLKADQEFFDKLTKNHVNEFGIEENSFLPLAAIHMARDKYLREVHGLTTFFRYPLRYLAEKLREYGFSMKRTSKGNVWLVAVPEIKEEKVYIKSDFSYPVCTKISNTKKKKFTQFSLGRNTLTMSTPSQFEEVSADASDAQNGSSVPVNAPLQEIGGKGLPVWASKTERPQFITGVKLPDPNDPNAIPWFTPPGFQDESIVRHGKFTRNENESKYCIFGHGRRSYIELTESVYQTIDGFSQAELDAFGDYNFIRDEAATAELFDKIEVGHIIGTMNQNDPFAVFALEVLRTFPGKDMIACRVWNGEVLERKYNSYKGIITDDPEVNTDLLYITFQDVSYGLANGNSEILYYKKPEPLDEKDKNLFAPYGYDDKVKEYHMVGRYRIAENYPGYVPDDKLKEEEAAAYELYRLANKAKLDEAERLAQEEAERKQIEKEEKLQKIKEELVEAAARKS